METPMKKNRYIVAVYELDRAYGGPEEGGWWFDTGDLVRVMSVHKSEDAAYAAARRINNLLDYRRWLGNPYTPRLSSVAYSGGHYAAEVFINRAPESFPEERPYYA
jgi:hypothetical protein